MDRTLVISATNVLASGYMVVPTDRRSPAGEPVNALFAVARAIARVLAFKLPSRAVAVIGNDLDTEKWPDILRVQLARLPSVLSGLGVHVVQAPGEQQVVASYAAAALAAGDDAIVIGRDKRFAQLVSDRVWWYDSNKDVRYTADVVHKRFTVGPEVVAEWLALVGDDGELPGVKGIGAKGATTIIEKYGTVEAALAQLDTIEGRIGKLLRAGREDIVRELAHARLDTTRPLPIPLAGASYEPPPVDAINALLQELGFTELLAAADAGAAAEVWTRPEQLQLGGEPAIYAVLEDDGSLTGIALPGAYVPRDSAAWPELARWLADPGARKLGHDLLGAIVALAHAGIELHGIAGDSQCASHLLQPSNWAPHELGGVAKQVLGRALPDDDAVRGVGRQRKAWSALPVEQVARVAAQRADTAAALWAQLGPKVERAQLAEYLELMGTCARMELHGITIEPAALDRAHEALAAIEAELTQQIEALAGHSFNINSGPQLGTVLFEELKLPIAGHTKTGWSTAIDALEKIEHAHPIVPLVIRWRLLRRLRDFWVVALRRYVGTDGRAHSRSHPARSFSGHLVNSNPDLSRVPGRTPEMEMIRRAFVAQPGWRLMSVDFNQLGLHVLAHLTKDPALVEPLRARADMHMLTAMAVLDKQREAVSDEERQLGKVINFATFAGQGASALALQLGVSAAEAKEYLARFDAHYAGVRAFQDEQLRLAREVGYITTIAGRRWPIGGLESLDNELRSYAERLARRATHEGSVADVARRALLDADRALRRAGSRAAPIVQVVDEVLFEVPDDEVESAGKLAAQAMRHAFELEVPLVVGVWAGKNWADLERLGEW
jgi:DNA polymerase-1